MEGEKYSEFWYFSLISPEVFRNCQTLNEVDINQSPERQLGGAVNILSSRPTSPQE